MTLLHSENQLNCILKQQQHYHIYWARNTEMIKSSFYYIHIEACGFSAKMQAFYSALTTLALCSTTRAQRLMHTSTISHLDPTGFWIVHLIFKYNDNFFNPESTTSNLV
uniref:Uncharacterized protein n=1 Tax=Micrurus carvalhoi TaxID=3147026 RepID=A0A2H6N4M1_9SAUR